MKTRLSIFLCILYICTFTIQAKYKCGIIPMPAMQQLESLQDSGFQMTPSTKIAYSNNVLKSTAQQLVRTLSYQTGQKLGEAQASQKVENGILLTVNPQDTLLLQGHITYGISPQSQQPIDERYAIRVDHKTVTVVGATVEGVARGCATLRQLIGCNAKVVIPAQTIKDAPLYAWRGLSLDVARSFIEMEEVKTVMDIMALYKMNVLHLHLSDNQGWRIEIKAYPELATKGGFVPNKGRKGGFFTQQQYSELVKYAAERNITIVPELDLPGHSDAIFKTYPFLNNAAHLPFDFDFPGQAPVSLDSDDEEATKMVESIIREICQLTPGRFIHIGGDETFGMDDDKYVRFVKRIRAIVHQMGKEVVGWQEMARAEVGKGDILQHWIAFSKKQMAKKTDSTDTQGKRSDNEHSIKMSDEVKKMLGATYMKAPKDLPVGIANGAKILLSPSSFVYLDCPYEEKSIDTLQYADQKRLGLHAYTPQNLYDMYDWNPKTYHTNIDWQKDVAGIEAAIWGESIESFRDMQFLLLPRLTGVAEKAWSHAEHISWDSYKSRLSAQCKLWEHYGWNYFKSSLIDWEQEESNPRLIVLTDIENEPDDAESLVRLLLYSNQLDLRGLIATTSTHMRHRTAPESILRIIDAYATVWQNLSRHEEGYPSPDSLRQLVKQSLPRYGMNGVGNGMDSEGSEWIIRELRRDDTRPLWITAWGGVNTLAQALFKMRSTMSADSLAYYISKLRVYAISDQDNAGAWLRREFPSLFYIVSLGSYSRATWTGISSFDSLSDNQSVSAEWLATHIQQGHGALGACYPDVAYTMEGDTPSFLGLIPNGLNCMEHPNWGGWGGRYEFYLPKEEDYMDEPSPSNGHVLIEKETRPIWTNAEDQIQITNSDGKWQSKGIRETIYRWRTEYQNDFAARMDWCCQPYTEANHPPRPEVHMFTVVAPYAEDNAMPMEIMDYQVKSGQYFALDASQSTDPDGDSLSFLWFCYPEAGSYKKNVEILGKPNTQQIKIQAPVVDKEETVHFILKVTDKGKPALTRYKRIIVKISNQL